MLRTNRFSFLTIFLIVVMCLSLMNVKPAFADDSAPPTEPPTEEVVETSEPVLEGEPALEEEENEEEIAIILLAEVPQNTEVIVLNDEGEPVSLATQEAAVIAQNASPVWCPAGAVPPIIPGTQGCTTGFESIGDLLANMNAEDAAEWSADYAQNGTIYLAATVNQATTISSAVTINNQTYANIFNNLSSYDLTLQGGWDSLTGAITGQTVFTGNDVFLQIGDSDNPWLGSVSVNNITLLDALAAANASLEVHSAATVNMTDVTVGGSGAGQNGVNISAFNTNLTNVRVEWADNHGISINAAGSGGTVTLNNVVASNNGRVEDGNRLGSGVFVNGDNTFILVNSGTFANNARFGIEALDSVSTTIPVAQAWTDQDDYFPGSIVTISGGNNSLNGVMLGFIPGETVLVYVVGPNGYTATCEGIANEFGQWSCQIALWDSELAIGDYYFVATGLTSGVSVTNGFTDARQVNSVTISGSNPRQPGATVSITVNVTTTQQGGNTWAATGYRVATNTGTMTCINHTDITSSGTFNTTMSITVPNTPGTYNLYIVAYSNNTCTQGASNTLTVNNAIVVADTTPPALSLPGNMTLQATGPGGRTVTFTATANDTIDGNRPVTCTPASGSTFPIGITTVNCSASDLSGNTANGSFTITIQDTTPPALTLPGNMTVEADDASGAVVSFSATAMDIVDGSRPVTCNPASGSTFPLGTTTVNCSATDTRNNTANGSFTVTVQDTLAPTLVLPADMIEEATSSAGAEVNFSATANDLVDGDLPVSCNPASGSTFPLGTTTVDCSVSDSQDNTTSGSFEVTIRDTTPPSITSQADIDVITSNLAGATVDYVLPTASDLVDGPISVSCAPASGSLFPVGSTLVTCTADNDQAGNSASPMTFNVVVTYVAPPPPPPPPPGPTPTPTPITLSDGTTITGFVPVTGTGYVFDIECPPSNFRKEYTSFNLVFSNLCGGYKGTVEFLLSSASLPGALAGGETFLNGFSVGILKDGVSVPLPAAAQISIEFIVPANDLGKNLAIMFWDGSKWVEVEGGALNGNIYQATVTSSGFYILVAK
jgi:hypothetical protein